MVSILRTAYIIIVLVCILLFVEEMRALIKSIVVRGSNTMYSLGDG